MAIKVFKFGGASISSAENMMKVVDILRKEDYSQLVIVASAIGKTTNALEKVVDKYLENPSEAIKLLEKIEQNHIDFCKQVLVNSKETIDLLQNHFVEGYWLLEEPPLDSYSYNYDQLVSIGELASTTILAGLLKEQGFQSLWLDARSFIKTTDNYQEGEIIWDLTDKSIQKEITPYLTDKIILTQGFIGCTDENYTTTLGREGSDYTGAIIANALSAESYTIWKDVSGVLNADPKMFKDTIQLFELTYKEAVEMTYYGAKVIHPKTIKPLENKKIPLWVRSFLDREKQGTKICSDAQMEFIKGVQIHLNNQSLLRFVPKDFSFIQETQISELMNAIKETGADINLFQRGAVEAIFVIDNNFETKDLIEKKLIDYSVEIIENVTLSTLRNYKSSEVEELNKNKEVFIEQKTPITYQIVYK